MEKEQLPITRNENNKTKNTYMKTEKTQKTRQINQRTQQNNKIKKNKTRQSKKIKNALTNLKVFYQSVRGLKSKVDFIIELVTINQY